MVKTFRQFLKEKELTEVIQPQDITTLIGQILPAQQPNNINNVADTLAKKNPALIGALKDSPAAQAIQAKLDALKRKTNPAQAQQNQSLGNMITSLPGTQS